MPQVFVPLDDRVLVEPDEPVTVSSGGIIIPDNAVEKRQRGIVRAVGPGKLIAFTGDRAAMSVEVGDDVLIEKYSGNEVEIGETVYYCVREENVLGVVKNDKK